MNRAEYERMAAVEGRHWWYRGLRDMIARVLRRHGRELPQRLRVLDAGCGTGENLRLLGELLQPAYLGGFDISPIAVELAAAKAPQADLYVSDICDPQIRCAELDLVLSCDVIYTPGLAAALPGLRRLAGRLAPGGMLLLNLPAYDWLYSDHDRAVSTSERFTAGQVRALLGELDLAPALVTYRLCGLFPLVVASRLPSILWPKAGSEPPASAIRLPSPALNAAFWQALRIENAAIDRGIRFPWGSSIFALGRKTRRT